MNLCHPINLLSMVYVCLLTKLIWAIFLFTGNMSILLNWDLQYEQILQLFHVKNDNYATHIINLYTYFMHWTDG